MKNIVGHIDFAQIVLYLFWAFFAGLIYYLRREDRREGYPLYSEPANDYKTIGFMWIPPPKVFKLPHGGTYSAPTGKPDDRVLNAQKVAVWPGAPWEPTGDPMLAAVGPGSYAERADKPDLTFEGQPKIVPMRVASNFAVDTNDRDPRGFTVIGADRDTAGTVKEIWVDRSETIIRYLEVTTNGGRSVLLPMTFASVNRRRGEVKVHAITASQFANVPGLARPDQVTLLEEDKICGYYGGGMLYATPSRQEPLL
jgi:photosynthetic reaction center H subunit